MSSSRPERSRHSAHAASWPSCPSGPPLLGWPSRCTSNSGPAAGGRWSGSQQRYEVKGEGGIGAGCSGRRALQAAASFGFERQHNCLHKVHSAGTCSVLLQQALPACQPAVAEQKARPLAAGTAARSPPPPPPPPPLPLPPMAAQLTSLGRHGLLLAGGVAAALLERPWTAKRRAVDGCVPCGPCVRTEVSDVLLSPSANNGSKPAVVSRALGLLIAASAQAPPLPCLSRPASRLQSMRLRCQRLCNQPGRSDHG